MATTLYTSSSFYFKRTYIDDISDDILCPLCYDSAISCSTSCHHLFCLPCIQNHLNSRLRSDQPTNCPMCRTTILQSELLPLTGEKLKKVQELRVSCHGSASGCIFFGHLKDVEIHEITCQHIQAPCRFRDKGCSVNVARKDMKQHESRCRYNPAVSYCRYSIYGCRIRGIQPLLEAHQKRCSRRNMGKMVKCPNFEFGCRLHVKKYFLDRHLQCCTFRRRSLETPSQSVIFEISLGWIDPKKMIPLYQLKSKLKTFLPNIKEVKEGRFMGEVTVSFKSFDLTSLEHVMMAVDPHISNNLSQLNLIKKGISFTNCTSKNKNSSPITCSPIPTDNATTQSPLLAPVGSS